MDTRRSCFGFILCMVGLRHMNAFPILTLMTLLPLLGGGALAIFGHRLRAPHIKGMGLGCALLTLLLSLGVAAAFKSGHGMQFQDLMVLFESRTLVHRMGVDGLSLPFVLLTTSLVPITLLSSWQSPLAGSHLYVALILILEGLLLGAFMSLNLVIFYVFFEATLVPLFLLVGLWGGVGRLQAAFKLLLYTAAGSLLMLLGILVLYHVQGSFDWTVLVEHTLPLEGQKWLWWAFFLAFAVKTPMVPLHTWLPEAHVSAPTGVSMLLAGVLLKLGGYGFLRHMVPLFPDASALYAPVVFYLSAGGLILISLVAFAQKNMKSLIAYASIAHMAVVTFGAFSHDSYGVIGAGFQMISHGLVSAALFLSVGILYRLYGSLEIKSYSGLFRKETLWSLLFFMACLGAIGLPGTSGFVGEFLVILGLAHHHMGWAAVVASGFVLSAAYMLTLVARVLFGVAKAPEKAEAKTANHYEMGALALLVVAILILGVRPGVVTKVLAASLQAKVQSTHYVSNHGEEQGV